jgi:ADP-ribose pyrophosphatase YjhB (NUDIX family)
MESYSYEVESNQLLMQAQRLQALAQAGVAYATNPYDLERYEEIRAISVKLLQELTEESLEKIIRVFASENGYQTPKVDVRAVLFREGPEILLVREKIDNGRWTLPGGWAEIGHTPFEVAAKEAYEETGLIVQPIRLLALFDKRKHPNPPQPWYVYKAFIQCEVQGGSLIQDTPETAGARWFREDGCHRLNCRPTGRRHLSWRRYSDLLPIRARQRFATDLLAQA